MIRKVLLHPMTLAFLFAGVGAGVAGLVAVSVLAFVLALASIAFLSMRKSEELASEDTLSDLGNAERAQLAPIRKLRNEISEIVQAKNTDVSIAVVGKDAIQEADHILEQCAKLVQLQRELKRNLPGSKASREKEALEADLSNAQTPEEKAALERALEAKRLELTHYGKAEDALVKIDANLRQAQAALSEMKARLSSVSASEALEPSSDISDTIGRLRSLGSSLEEAEEWLKGQA